MAVYCGLDKRSPPYSIPRIDGCVAPLKQPLYHFLDSRENRGDELTAGRTHGHWVRKGFFGRP